MKEENVIEKDMTPKLIGETYLRKPTETSQQRYKYGVYMCQYCGKEFETQISNVKRGHTKSCGCLNGDAHGLTSHRFYKTWKHMVDRCNNPKIKAYKDYGGRGISVCEEWLNIRNFVDWAEKTYPNREGYTLDRIDNDLDYSPKNCRWVDKSTQVINQRIRRTNTSGYVGVTWVKNKGKWSARVQIFKRGKHIGYYLSKEEAVQARDNYIIENNLPHKLSTDYVREIK